MDNINSGLYIPDDALFDFAAQSAKLLRPKGERSGRDEAAALRRSIAFIRRSHALIERRYGGKSSVPAALEWIIDNLYIIEREGASALEALRRARRLRQTGEGSVMLELCRALVRSGRGEVTESRCLEFLRGFQSVTVLRRAELYLFPAALRAALIEAVASVCRAMEFAAESEDFAPALERIFTALRLFSVLDLEELLDGADMTAELLRAEPDGIFSRMDSASRGEYLRRIERLSRRAGVEEHIYARRLLKRARAEGRHVGEYLFPAPSSALSMVYIAANVLLTLFAALLTAFWVGSAAAGILLLLPLSELIKGLIDFILLRLAPPRRILRMDAERGVPPEGRSICVVSALLTDAESAAAAAAKLELLRLGSRREGDNLMFGLLADLPSADAASMPDDEAIISAARDIIEALNGKYGGGFYLFTREREFDGERWSAHERKRGALLELARLLLGRESRLHVTGERGRLAATKYIITLDSDTQMYPGAAGELIAAMLHPLNRAKIDPRRRVVVSGYGIIQPRITTELSSAAATDFALIFSGGGGSDPYAQVCGELYMDCFDCGGFSGKGIIDAHALLECTAALPEGQVLSHDALEGAFLRGGYMGDAEFVDAFPARPMSYYKRLHRWVRGDWQNAPWLFAAGRALRDIDRWRLFDSLRRSLTPPMTLLAIVLGFFLPGRGLAASGWAALLALTSRLIISLSEWSRNQPRQRHARILSGVGGALVECFIRLWLLPFEAWVCLSAALTALWRMLVTGRGLMQWQTAAQSDREGTELYRYIIIMWPVLLLGAALMVFSPVIIGKSSGLMWLFSPAALAALALPAYRDEELSAADREYIRERAAESWRYLHDYSTAEDNYLPPDNFQQQPPVGIAHRSSPTNIGFAMAAAVAACDMEIISRGEAAEYIGRVVGSLEKLPRCMGHFFNWYDTRTLLPLAPAFISTVDSGNLLAGLIACSMALRDWNMPELAARLQSLIEPMDFAPLYDARRGLFYICYDCAKERPAGGWYDLMASEAMLTSYIAVARGDVPIKHWRRLSRAQLQKDGYCGLASWTGTMFEYLMPELFLPLCRDSLLYESCKFCLYAQKRRRFAGKPWGMSESAYYSLDAALSYRYKAHGCAALALKRGQDADFVVSPYSSFLALLIEPDSAVKNLRRLERFGALGRMGFIEALDFTPGRCHRDEGERVRCYMAHHVGMSIIAAANAVCTGSMQRRFMSESAMAAYSLLIKERVPEDARVIRRERSESPERPPRRGELCWQLRGEGGAESFTALSNGVYNLLYSSKNASRAVCGGVCVYDFPGIELSLRLGGEDISFASGDCFWELGEEHGRISLERGGIRLSAECFVAAGEFGEVRDYAICADRDMHGLLSLGFTPLLAPLSDYVNHPAFWRLGIHAECEGGALILRRCRRAALGEQWLCVAASEEMSFTADSGGGLGWLSHPELCAAHGLSLTAGQEKKLRLTLCLARSRQAALDGALRLLAVSELERGSMCSAAAALTGMSGEETGEAMAMLPDIIAPPLHEAAPRRELWRCGISGDLPLICCEGRAQEAESLLRRFCLLKSCGVEADLVYLSPEHGEYHQPLVRRIERMLSEYSLEALVGARGGVHFAPLDAMETISSRAAVFIARVRPERSPLPMPKLGAARVPGAVPETEYNGLSLRFKSLPGRCWQNILTNGSYGWIAADCGMGAMWYKNAREMRINRPAEDISAIGGTERLWLELNGRRISLFAANDGEDCVVEYSPGLARWEKNIPGRSIVTTGFIPCGIDARVLIIEGAAGLALNWSLELCMGASDGSSVICRSENGIFTAENPESYYPGLVFRAAAGIAARIGSDFSPAGMCMTLNCPETLVLACGCCGAAELIELCKPANARRALSAVKSHWGTLLNRFTVSAAGAALDRYLSGWGAYQTIACRLEGRCSLYQSGGAIGFRDQLQDGVNLMLISPVYARERILDACRHQYIEGDVMHWWHPHPEGDKGIRSRCSDDLLWLVWALCEYVEASGDLGICDIEEYYVNSPLLAEAERDRYELPERSGQSASVIDHARSALERCISRGFGAHGLPLMGSGDWNDGLDDSGGESLWLGWFFAFCAEKLAALLDKLCKPSAERYRNYARLVAEAANEGWNGQWYLRGYLADGSAMGGVERIDSIAQSWAALSGHADAERAKIAVESALCKLVDAEHGLIRLFSPPYSPDERYPGYISSYGEGFRENGGQYTHGAIWLAMSCYACDMPDAGRRLLEMLLPENLNPLRYQAEPFVLAADVYSAPGHEGEAGWSWYTGSAGWYLRAAAECMLGLRLRGGRLYIDPPENVPLCRVRWVDFQGTAHTIEYTGRGVLLDGKKYTGGAVG